MNLDNLPGILEPLIYLGVGLLVGRLFSEKWAQKLFRIETIALFVLLFLCVPISIASVVHPGMPDILRFTFFMIMIVSILVLFGSFWIGLGFVSRPSLRDVGLQVLLVATPPLSIIWCLATFSAPR
jgi:hypothetical protein